MNENYLNPVERQDTQRDYLLAWKSLKLKYQADKLSTQALCASKPEISAGLERKAEELLHERKAVIRQISPTGVIYNC